MFYGITVALGDDSLSAYSSSSPGWIRGKTQLDLVSELAKSTEPRQLLRSKRYQIQIWG